MPEFVFLMKYSVFHAFYHRYLVLILILLKFITFIHITFLAFIWTRLPKIFFTLLLITHLLF
jgi:hypothetical protein